MGLTASSLSDLWEVLRVDDGVVGVFHFDIVCQGGISVVAGWIDGRVVVRRLVDDEIWGSEDVVILTRRRQTHGCDERRISEIADASARVQRR